MAGPPLLPGTVDFCENYDQSSFDPAYDSEPLTFFEPMVRRMLDETRRRRPGPEATHGYRRVLGRQVHVSGQVSEATLIVIYRRPRSFPRPVEASAHEDVVERMSWPTSHRGPNLSGSPLVTKEARMARTRGASRGRRAEVFDAAAQIFYEKGYEAASIQDIADQLGLLKGSLYYYISSKEDVLYEIIDTATHDETRSYFDDIVGSDEPMMDRSPQIRCHGDGPYRSPRGQVQPLLQ